MNFLIFGATGRTGRELLAQSLAAGHHVTAFVRNPEIVRISSPNLAILQGDVLMKDTMQQIVPGSEVVFSTLKINDGAARIRAIEHIIALMHTQNIRRILAVGGSGCLQVNDTTRYHELPEFPDRFRQTSLAHWEVCERLAASGLDWTFVCPPDIVDGERREGYIVQPTYRPAGKQITTAALAAFMLDESQQNRFVHKRVGICFPDEAASSTLSFSQHLKIS